VIINDVCIDINGGYQQGVTSDSGERSGYGGTRKGELSQVTNKHDGDDIEAIQQKVDRH